MAPVRIALVCPYDWSAPGGVQVHVGELATELRGRGHEVVVLAPSTREVRDEHVLVVGSPVPVRYNGSTAPIDPRPWRIPDVRRALRSIGPDVVHAHEPLAPSTSMWALLASEVPVVATFHSGADRSWLFDLTAPVMRRLARRIAARIAVSRRARAFVQERIGGEFRLVPNGIDVDAFARAEPADLGPGRKLLFVGRLDRRKGFPVALEAFRRIARERDDVRLIVVGAGTERAALDRIPEALRPRVRMLGAVSNRDLPTIHRASDVFLAPSLGGESFGVILIEAMAAGMPIVASRIGGYDEVVEDGETGLLVPPGDAGALAAAAGRLLEDRPFAATLAAAAERHARRYDWSVVAGQVEEVYASALGGRATSARPVR